MYHSDFVLRAVKLNREETNVRMEKQRNVYLDIVKLFTMYLVILDIQSKFSKNRILDFFFGGQYYRM